MGEAFRVQFATPSERIAFVLGFGILLVGLILLIAGAGVVGLIVAILGGIDLIWSIVKVQRRAPAVNDDSQKPPTR
jgi:hypothetical protein